MSDSDQEMVRQFLLGLNARMPTTLADEDSLIRSGILDSSALFELILWIEEKTGKPLDPTHFDFLAEFDSIDGIAHYLEAGRSG